MTYPCSFGMHRALPCYCVLHPVGTIHVAWSREDHVVITQLECITGQFIGSHSASGGGVSGSHKNLTFPGRQLRVEIEPGPEWAFCTKIKPLGIFDQEI